MAETASKPDKDRREYYRRYNEEHADQRKQYREETREQRNEYQREWRKKNPERVAYYQLQHYLKKVAELEAERK